MRIGACRERCSAWHIIIGGRPSNRRPAYANIGGAPGDIVHNINNGGHNDANNNANNP